VDVEAPGGEHGNVQTGGRGARGSTINLLGCSTSVALATGPTDEEEEEYLHMQAVINNEATAFYPLPCNYDKFILRVKVKVTLEQATKTQRGSRGIAILFL